MFHIHSGGDDATSPSLGSLNGTLADRTNQAFALRMGGAFSIQHTLVRVVLWMSGKTPWRYARFLNSAAERVLLQKVGGGYRFIRRMVQE